MAYRRREGETQHQARERIARDKGYGSYREYRAASAQERQRATRRLIDERGERSTYARGARGADVTIRNRARARVETPAGTIYTTRDRRRLRAIVDDAQARGRNVELRVVVQTDAFDRRRTDPRRAHGRDTGVRTVRVDGDDLHTSSAADFGEALGDAIADGLDDLYAGAGSGSIRVDTITVVVS